MNTPVCARSWGTLAAGWWFCTLPRGHAGACSCAGHEKPSDARYFEDQPEAAAALRKQSEKHAKEGRLIFYLRYPSRA